MTEPMTTEEIMKLEADITSVLGNGNASSAELGEIIIKAENALISLTADITTYRGHAADLTSCDAEAATRSIAKADAAALNKVRLQASLPKLRERLDEALHSERLARWRGRRDEVLILRDHAVELFRTYQQHADAIVELFRTAAAVDREIDELNRNAPYNQQLAGVELTARNIPAFDRDRPKLAGRTELPAFDVSARKLWPETSSGAFAASYAMSMTAPSHPGADWGTEQVRQQQRDAAEAERQRISAFYQSQTEQQKIRQNREAREQAEQLKRTG